MFDFDPVPYPQSYSEWQENERRKQEREKRENKKQKNTIMKMSKDNYWTHIANVAIWVLGLTFGLLFALLVIVTFITWDFNFYNAMMNFFIESPMGTRGFIAAAIAIIFIVGSMNYAGHKDKRKRSRNW